MNSRKTKFDIYTILLLSVFFDAYALFYIGNYPVTIFTLSSVVFLILQIVRKKVISIKLSKYNVFLISLICYLIINYVRYGFANTPSLLQFLYFMVLCLLAYRSDTRDNFERYCALFQKMMTIMSIYGIYQFLGRLKGLPLTDLIIKNHMVQGYNWTNTTYIGGHEIWRSNAIFREPSYFGQMLAISLFFYFSDILIKKKINRKTIISALLQTVALIMTMSGTSILMLISALILYSMMIFRKKILYKRIVPILFSGLILVLLFLILTPFGTYYLKRFNELSAYNENASSGFVRFRAWILVVREAWQSDFIFGSGIGTGSEYIERYSSSYNAMTLNGFAKVAAELGFLGVVLWILSIMSVCFRKENVALSSKYLSLGSQMIPLIFMHEASSSNIFWVFMILLNCRIVAEKKIFGMEVFKKNDAQPEPYTPKMPVERKRAFIFCGDFFS